LHDPGSPRAARDARRNASDDTNRAAVRLTYATAFFAFLLVNTARVLLSLYALSLGADAFAVGTIGAMLYVLPLLLVWGVGMLFDRLGARWLLLFGAVCGMLGMLVPYFVHSLPALYAAAALGGVAVAFSNVVLQGLLGNLSLPDERTRNFSTFSMVVSVSSFSGPLLVGFTIDRLGHGAGCLVLAAAASACVLLMLLKGGVLPAARPARAPGGNPLKSLADPGIRRMLAVSSLMQFGVDLFQFYLPIYGHGIGLSASAIGVVLAAYAVAALLVRFIMPWLIERLGEEGLLSWAFFLGAVLFLAVPLSRSAPLLALIAFLFGLCVGCGGPLTLMLMLGRSRAGRPGETLGLRLTVNYLTRMAGPTLCGFVASMAGLLPVFFLNAIMMFAGGLLARPRSGAGTPGQPDSLKKQQSRAR